MLKLKLKARLTKNATVIVIFFSNNTLRYALLVGISCLSMPLVSICSDFKYKRLKYRQWVPYDYSSLMIYCFTYAHQAIAVFHTAGVNIACDSFICALLMYVCCQFEILQHRLKNITDNWNTVAYCIYHHNRIFELIIKLEIMFLLVLLLRVGYWMKLRRISWSHKLFFAGTRD